MSSSSAAPDTAPGHRLLDIRERDGDGPGLRAWARELTSASGLPHTSRSYRDPYALVAWHAAPVGVDLERVEPFEPGFLVSIATPEERRRPDLAAAGPEDVASLWSAKEALAKALGDPLAHDPRRLGSPSLWEGGAAGLWRARRLTAPPGHVAWLVWQG